MQLVEIIEWQPDWAKDFDVLATRIRKAAGSSVVRVDHIGSTSVPGMAAKEMYRQSCAASLTSSSQRVC